MSAGKGTFYLLGLLALCVGIGWALINGLDDTSPAVDGPGQSSTDSETRAADGSRGSRQRSLSAPAVVPRVEADPQLSQGYGTRKAQPPEAVSPGVGDDGAGETAQHTLFASAYQMQPLALNFDEGPFEKRQNGNILKTDTAAQAALVNQPDTSTEDDIGVLGSLIDQYRRIFGANPVAGDNRDLVHALTGNNPHKLEFIDPSNPAISASGELVDRWGTPFRFHAVDSRRPMEIFSAGPDASFGTSDDVMIDAPEVIGPQAFGEGE